MEQAWYVEDQQAYEEHMTFTALRRKARKKMESVMRALGVSLPDDDYNYSGWKAVRCPFHADRRASASVNLQKNYFRCHACDISGDPVRIVMSGRGWDEEKAVTWILNST